MTRVSYRQDCRSRSIADRSDRDRPKPPSVSCTAKQQHS